MTEIDTWHIHISGQEQGVGLRPSIYQLARQFGLTNGLICYSRHAQQRIILRPIAQATRSGLFDVC